MVTAGKLDLKDRVGDYLDVPEDKAQIRLDQLVAHLSDIRHYKNGEKTPEFLSQHYDKAADAIQIFIDDPLAFEPGSRYQYTSFGYNLLAAVIEKVAGKPYTQWVEKNIMKQMGLKHTAFDDATKTFPNRTENYDFFTPYKYEPRDELQKMPPFDYSYNNGGGNILTTAEDLAQFGLAFTREGFFSKEELVLFQNRIVPESSSPWSMGWFLSELDGGEVRLNMTGAFAGTQAGIYIYPGTQTVVVALSNCWGKGSNSGDMVMAVPQRIANIVIRS